MPRRVAVGVGALLLVIFSGLIIVLPLAHAQSTISTISISIPQGAGGSAAGAPGYSPDSITVFIGMNNTVVWTNDDVVGNTVTSLDVPAGATAFDSGVLLPSTSKGMPWQTPTGVSFTQTFTVPGTYHYHCTQHSWMTGTVIVEAAFTPAPEFPAASLAVILFAVIAAVVLAVARLRPASVAGTRERPDHPVEAAVLESGIPEGGRIPARPCFSLCLQFSSSRGLL